MPEEFEEKMEGEEEGEEEVIRLSPAERPVTCKICGREVAFKEYPRHMKEEHPEEYEEYRRRMSEGRKKAWERAKARIAEPAEEAEEMPPEQMVALMGREGLERLKFKRLMEFLKTAPGVTQSQIRWVETRWNTYSKVREDASELFRVLKEEAGIKDKVAMAIVQAVFSLEAEYADILARRGEPVFIGRQQEEWSPLWPQGLPQPPRAPQYQPARHWHEPPPYQPYYPPAYPPYYYQPPYRKEAEGLTEEKLYEILDRYLSERLERRRAEEKIEELRHALEGLKDYVEEQRHEFEKLLLKREAEKKGAESPEVLVLKSRMEDADRKIDALAAKLSELSEILQEKEKAKLEAEIRALRAEQRSILEKFDEFRRTVSTIGGYQSDAYKLVGQALQSLEGRRPLELVVRALFPELGARPVIPPQTKTALPPEVESELRSAGLIEPYGG
ncbi:MAG: hypothetical protein QXP81_10250 [Nitrososphaerota archaeon]